MNKKHLSAIAITVLLASGVAAGQAQAARFDPLSPVTQQNALRTAKSYLQMSGYSHDGLINQLEYEQYSAEDATWAADNVGADWNQQAVRTANSYLKMSGYSHDGLVNQLEYEGYTASQAEYGATAAGV